MVIGLSGILIFFVGLGLSYIPDIGVVASYVLRVTAILAIVGLYELVVRFFCMFFFSFLRVCVCVCCRV